MTDREIASIHVANQIRHLFLTKWAGKWVSEKELRGQNRLWQRVFSELVKQGYIEKRVDGLIIKYRWREPL